MWWELSQNALMGAIESGLVYGFVALVVYISFRILNFPDMTVDGSFLLDAAVVMMLILAGINMGGDADRSFGQSTGEHGDGGAQSVR